MKKKKTYLNPPDWLAEAFKTGNKEQMAQLLIDVNFDKAGWNKFRYKCVGPDPNDVYIYGISMHIYISKFAHISRFDSYIYMCFYCSILAHFRFHNQKQTKPIEHVYRRSSKQVWKWL